MSTAALADLVRSAARLNNGVGSSVWLHDAVENQLRNYLASAPDEPASDCLVVNIENFLTRALLTLSQVADSLLKSPHVHAYINRHVQKMEMEDDFSELDPLTDLNDKFLNLQSFVSQLSSLAESRAHSGASAFTPVYFQNTPNSLRDPHQTGGGMASPISQNMENASTTQQEIEDEVDDDEVYAEGSHTHADASDYLASTSRRGKGEYYCPYKRLCKKGGVNTDGSLVLFYRNSAFRIHMQKHEKPYKCDLPGCNNSTGFARRDQLERHQKKVRHE